MQVGTRLLVDRALRHWPGLLQDATAEELAFVIYPAPKLGVRPQRIGLSLGRFYAVIGTATTRQCAHVLRTMVDYKVLSPNLASAIVAKCCNEPISAVDQARVAVSLVVHHHGLSRKYQLDLANKVLHEVVARVNRIGHGHMVAQLLHASA